MTAGVTGESIRLSAPAGLEYTSFTDPQGVFNGTGRLDGGTVLSGVVAASAQGHHLVIGCAGATSSVEGVMLPVASARCRLTQSRRFGRAGLASAVPVQMWQRVGLTQWMAQSLLAQGSGAQWRRLQYTVGTLRRSQVRADRRRRPPADDRLQAQHLGR
jgi:hypothetical protein